MSMSSADEQVLEMGQIVGVYGVKGWLKVKSFTSPEENILDYSPWVLEANRAVSEIDVIQGKRHGKGLVVKFRGIDDRDAASLMLGKTIYLKREQLPPAAADEYYWADLVNLEVLTSSGISLGTVSHLMETGANDVLVVQGERERLIPFVQGDYVESISLDDGKIVVNWDPDF